MPRESCNISYNISDKYAYICYNLCNMGQSASIDNKCLLVPVLILVNSFNGERISGCRKRVCNNG